MFAKYPNLTLGALLIVVLGAGAVQSNRVEHLRESEAFYRWIIAAATSERLFEGDGDEFRDGELYASVVAKADPLIADVAHEADADAVSRLGAMVSDGTHDQRVWRLASGSDLAEPRAEFLRLVRAQELGYVRDIQYAEAQASGVNLFNLFFGFRRVAANFVWLQVDRFWHMGMMHRMIPLMKTCVTLDPNFVDAYILGAWHLAYNATARMPDTPMHLRQWHPRYEACVGEKEMFYYLGVDFLKDGIRHNPRNYKLYFDLGYGIYDSKLGDYENAVRYLAEAVRQPHERWVPRRLYAALESNGQYAEALAGWEDYLERFPDHEVAQRFILRNTGLLYENRADELLAEANEIADQNPDQAAALRESADDYYARALGMWEQMNEPFAEARILRRRAVQLAEEQRYLEAIAVLDHARWESSTLFEEASNMIIEYKIRAGIPLSVSEQKAVLRQEMGDDCPGSPAAQAA